MTQSKTSQNSDGTMSVVTTGDDNILRSVVQWEPRQVELIYGLEIGADMPEEKFRMVRKYTDSYVKAQCQAVDLYLNRTLTLCGCMMHPVKVRFNDDGKGPIIDSQTGEVLEYDNKYRQIIKVAAVDGKELPEPILIAFVSMAIEQEFVQTLMPRYGPGDWNTMLDVVIERIRTRSGGQSYNMRFV